MPQERLHSTWLHSDRFIPRRFVRPTLRFTAIESSSGVLLLAATVAALLWANAAFGDTYERFWEARLELNLAGFHLEESLRGLVNDGLMAVFFFVVGLEIKRELVVGELRDPKAAALPVVAALGGMLVPALIYLSFVGGGEAVRGWGIPMATDIAFSIGVVALLGARVPVGAKLFLLALAIADDIGAITVIALFYTDDLAPSWLVAGLLGLGATAVANRAGVRSLVFYVPLALGTWLCFLESGVHATIAGVALGLLTPARPMYSAEEFDRKAVSILDAYPAQTSREKRDHEALLMASVARESVAPLNRLEHALHPWSSFVVVPLFALSNAGIRFSEIDLAAALTHPVAVGVALGLLVGKTVGISLFAVGAVRLGLARLPAGTSWRHLVGVAALAGIGFTVSLFIAGLAFTDPELADRAKLGIFVGSAAAGAIGYLILRRVGPAPPLAIHERQEHRVESASVEPV